jgi:hypothetical protein
LHKADFDCLENVLIRNREFQRCSSKWPVSFWGECADWRLIAAIKRLLESASQTTPSACYNSKGKGAETSDCEVNS